MYPIPARGKPETVRKKAYWRSAAPMGARLDGKANISKLSINFVMWNKPNALTRIAGLNQKVSSRLTCS